MIFKNKIFPEAGREILLCRNMIQKNHELNIAAQAALFKPGKSYASLSDRLGKFGTHGALDIS